MNRIITNTTRKAVAFFALAMIAGLCSCTGDFEQINDNPNGLDPSNIPVESRFSQPMQSIYLNVYNRNYEYQLQQNLNADLYSGYLANPTAFGGNNNNSTYYMQEGWNNMAFRAGILYVMKPISQILAITTLPDYIALAKIIRVAAISRVSDIYGPLPYSKAMQGGESVEYDSQEQLYGQFFTELEEAVTALTAFVDSDPAYAEGRIKRFDQMCDGDYKRWIRFANTLRLRLAMRIVKVDPAKAKTIAEAAVNHPYGVLTLIDKNITVKQENLMNPLQVITQAYRDICAGASFTSIMNGYEDPRMPKMILPVGWAGKAHGDAENGDIRDASGNPLGQIGKYIGIRQGAIVDKPKYMMYSIVNMDKDLMFTTSYPLPIMKVAEAYFLRAEGALRGWSMGNTAQALYEEGIRVSFDEYGLSAADYSAYIADDVKMAADYVDPQNAVNNHPALNLVTVKWNDTASNEVKLQKVITQKWIAMFPEGQEAWSEFRRTGYPKLFPVVDNRSGGVIPNGEFIKRLTFTQDEKNSNAEGVAQAVSLLNGPDAINTRLWWDVDKGNF